MVARYKFIYLIIIMISVTLVVTAVSMFILYDTAVNVERERLTETAQSQARLIEAVARFDRVHSSDYPDGSLAATLSQIRDAHANYKGFGETGEFTLARRQGDNIVFLLRHRHYDLDNPEPVPFDSNLAQPMRLALSGKSGTVLGLDYRGVAVLAAYEPISELGLGIVAKIDLAEVRTPFIRAALVIAAIGCFLVLSGAVLFQRISNPIIRKLESHNKELAAEVKERKSAQEEIRQLNQDLEKRVQQRTRQLLMINNELESFVYSVSHDLRAPLRAISGFAEIISRRHRSSLNEQGQHYFDNIVEAADQMGKLIEDLLAYSRLGKSALSIGPVNLNIIIGQVLRDFEERIEQAEAVLDIPENMPTVNADQTLMTVILRNLFENALTYHHQNVRPEIRIDCRKDDSGITIGVHDNGIGIPAEYHGKVFDIFQRLHPQSKYPGSGIGLGLVKKAVEIMDGKVELESIPDMGTSFFIWIPENVEIVGSVREVEHEWPGTHSVG